MSAAALLGRLDKVRAAGAGRWMAACPAHEDRSPSLSIRELDDGRILIKCFAACGAADVMQAVGLSLGDLFPKRLGGDFAPIKNAHVHAAVAAMKSIDHDALLIAIAAEQLAKGEPLSADDHQLLLAAANRVRKARKAAA